MEYRNTSELTLTNREEACKKVKQIANIIGKIKINNYLKAGEMSEEDKKKIAQLESNMNNVANENGLQKLATQLRTKISERYDIKNEENPNQINDRLEAYRGATDAQVAALMKGKISKAKKCQQIANTLFQQLEPNDKLRAIEYKRGTLANLNKPLEKTNEEIQQWIERLKECWKEEDFNKRKDITQKITEQLQQTNSNNLREKSSKELFSGVEI